MEKGNFITILSSSFSTSMESTYEEQGKVLKELDDDDGEGKQSKREMM
jgi:hypothetical protein